MHLGCLEPKTSVAESVHQVIDCQTVLDHAPKDFLNDRSLLGNLIPLGRRKKRARLAYQFLEPVVTKWRLSHRRAGHQLVALSIFVHASIHCSQRKSTGDLEILRTHIIQRDRLVRWSRCQEKRRASSPPITRSIPGAHFECTGAQLTASRPNPFRSS